MFDKIVKTSWGSFEQTINKCATDQRPNKIDLVLGVYRDEFGKTPILSSVRLAEEIIRNTEDTKAYLSLAGREHFITAMRDLVLESVQLRDRAMGLQTVGGAGAIRALFDLTKLISPFATVWLSNPGYSAHETLARAARLAVQKYPYLDNLDKSPDLEKMFSALKHSKNNDIIVLDASCQNPTGVDLSLEEWKCIATLCQKKGLIPLLDLAYYGFAQNARSNTMAIEVLSNALDNVLVAVSCSKMFGIYRERAGVALMIGPKRESIMNAMQKLTGISFATYGVPPDHGAAIVDIILSDSSLRSLWESEVLAMRQRLVSLRLRFATAIEDRMKNFSMDHVASGNGMFCLLPLGEDQMDELSEKFAIYGLKNGRINIACLQSAKIDLIVQSIAEVS